MNVEQQGVTKDRYTLIPRTLIFITSGKRVLLLKGSPNKRLWSNQYNGIGGHVERGEDVLTAAKRELAEETGLVVPDLWLCGIITVDTSMDTGIGIFVYRGDSSQKEVTPSSEGELDWVLIKEINELPLVEDLNVILPNALAIKTGEHPFYAHYSYDEKGELHINFVS
jgi:8-oxo-dGTP diphosphatase